MKVTTSIRNIAASLIISVQIIAFPAFSYAQEAAPEATTSESTSAPAPGEATSPRGASNTGPTTPTGADSSTYTQNSDGTWSNGTYTWNPTTKQTSPNTPQNYSYNPATGQWDTTDYIYSPESGKYVPNVRSVAAAPASSIQSTGPNSTNQTTGSTAAISGTGPNSNNTIGGNNNINDTFNLFFNGAISNNINSNAVSGDALVQGNTKAGSALSGDAVAIANVLNMLQSSWLGQSSDVASFVSNLDGNVYGDLLIDPNQLPYAIGNTNSNLDVNIDNNGVINNDITLTAKSGNAAVSGNTAGGDASTGNARAMANVINLMNSAIHSGKSFIGMVNINGDYDGDILLPRGLLDTLIASTGPNSNNVVNGNHNLDVAVDSTANRTINNAVNATAGTGNALLNNNTTAGSATTGQAQTTTNTMNVVGQNITGKNGLLVFVNVLGKWVGMVVGPANATINNTGPNSNNTIDGNSNQSVSVNANENSLINNNINVNAQSGDATVSNNTSAGNARSGDATATVNLLNVIGSDINVDDWFGVLFVNVFGQWFGDFGNDSAHGGFSQNPNSAAQSNNQAQVFGFNTGQASTNASPSRTVAFLPFVGGGTQEQSATTDQSSQNQAVFGSTTPSNTDGTSSTSSASTPTKAPLNTWIIVGIVGFLATGTVVIREYIIAVRAERVA